MNKKYANPLLDERAIAVAREALAELGDEGIGKHVGVTGVGRNVATHRFAAQVPGYPGWEWQAVVACAEGSDRVTVNEVALVPGGGALQPPEWVPYAERLRPGDLGPGDLLPPEPYDERLDEDGNLTTAGLKQAQDRWRTGAFGPNSEMAAEAPLQCKTCAFWVQAGQPLGPYFGACVNEYSADGRVVHATYGCGAHSKTKVDSDLLAADAAFDDEKPVF